MIPSYSTLLSMALVGNRVSPRGEETREVERAIPVVFRAGETLTRSNFNKSLAYTEALTHIAGVFDLNLLQTVSSASVAMRYTHQSDYGPRMMYQLDRAFDSLRTDPDTRRAVVLIDRKEDVGTGKETCATGIQFMIRKGALNSIVTMRSWDMCLGMPYDIVCYGALTQAMARALHVPAGTVTVNAGSLHVYVKDKAKARTMTEGKSFTFTGPGNVQSWTAMRKYAATLLQLVPWPDTSGIPYCFKIE